MSQSILRGLVTRDYCMAHTDHILQSAAVLLKQKLINMHVTFDLSSYCRVLLGGSEDWLQIQGAHAIRHYNRWCDKHE